VSAPSESTDQSVPGLLRLPQAVLFGPGQRQATAAVLGQLGKRVLICTDARLAVESDFVALLESLREAGLDAHVFSGTEAELPVDGVLACVHEFSSVEVDVVVGIGGGSCIDMAKVVALILTHGGHPSDYYGEFLVPGPVVPVVAIPTTAGTGSEATPVAVLADPNRDMKVGISSPYLIPHTAICDPELTYSCPPELTASAGADALTHLVESFTAVQRQGSYTLASERVFVGKSTLTDVLALQGLALMRRNLLPAYEDSTNVTARSGVMFAAFLGGISLGTAGTAAAHALQYPLGAATHTPHGVGVGVLMPYVMRYNLPVRIAEFTRIATALGVSRSGLSEEAHAREGVLAVDRLLDGIGLPRTIAEMGMPKTRIDWLAEQAMGATRLVQNNPRPLDVEAMMRIATAAYDGDRSFD